MSRRVWASVAAGVLGSLAVCGAATAQVVSDVTYTLDAGDPTLSTHYHDACTLHPGAPSPGPYETRLMTVATAGVYSVTDISAPKDGSMALLIGALNPGALLANCYVSVDDAQAVFLNAGFYNVVLTTLGDGTGDYGYRFNGPAALTFAPAPPLPPTIPTLSEWAMILLGALLLGAGGWTLQRRRMA